MSREKHGGLPNRGSSAVPSIPLSDANLGRNGEPTIGNLVKDATSSMSTLFRSEVALAKAEVVGEAKKAGAGTGLLIGAAVMLLYSSFFFFFFLAELLDTWLPRWAAFLIVFALLLLITATAGFVGYLVFKRVRGPKKTIETVKEVPTVLPKLGGSGEHSPAPKVSPAAPATRVVPPKLAPRPAPAAEETVVDETASSDRTPTPHDDATRRSTSTYRTAPSYETGTPPPTVDDSGDGEPPTPPAHDPRQG